MGPFKKYAFCIKAFFIPFTYITLCQFYSITSITTKKQTMEWEKRGIFVCLSASTYHVISKELENCIMNTIAFLDAHVCVNSPYWQNIGIITFFCKYYIVVSDTLIGSCMCFSCCSLWYYRSSLRNEEGNIKLQRKIHRRICKGNIKFLAARSPSYVAIVAYFVFSLPFFYSRKKVFSALIIQGISWYQWSKH